MQKKRDLIVDEFKKKSPHVDTLTSTFAGNVEIQFKCNI